MSNEDDPVNSLTVHQFFSVGTRGGLLKKLFLVFFLFNFKVFAVSYSHSLELDISAAGDLTKDAIEQEMKRTQKYFDQCGIQIQYNYIEKADIYPFREWETFWFNHFELSPTEKEFAEIGHRSNAHLLFVDSLNWTLQGQGTWGAAYADYILDQLDSNPEILPFVHEELVGLSVVGKYRADWTVAHELAHVVLNLQHTKSEQNIMHSGHSQVHHSFDENGFLKSNLQPTFSKSQCEKKLDQNRYLRRLIL